LSIPMWDDIGFFNNKCVNSRYLDFRRI